MTNPFRKRGADDQRPRPNAFSTDIRRTITGNLKRFISLFIITALGATMLVGLKAACDDLRATADAYYDGQCLFDISVKSTLGLDKDDIKALSELDGVDVAEGGYTETVYTEVDGTNEKVDLKALSAKGLNEPLVVDGRLPRDTGEVAVTRQYLDKSGKKIGDKITFEGMGEKTDDGGDGDAAASTSSEIFTRRSYTITGAVLDPMDVNNGESLSFRNTSGSKYAFFLTLGAVENRDTFTVAYLTVKGASALPTYSDEYDALIDQVKQEADGIRGELEDARTDGIKADVNATIDEEEADANAQLSDAQAKIDDAQAQINSGASQLSSAERELASNRNKVADGLNQIASGLGCSVDQIEHTLASKQAQLDTADQQLASGRSQLTGAGSMLGQLPYVKDVWPQAAWNRLVTAKTVDEARAAAAEVDAVLDPFVAQATGVLDGLIDYICSEEFRAAMEEADNAYDALPEAVRVRIESSITQMPTGVQAFVRSLLNQTPDQIAAQLTEMRGFIAQLSQLAPGMVQVVQGEQQASSGRAQLDEARAAYNQLQSAQAQLADGQKQIDANRATIASGQAELDRNRKEFEDKKADAEAQFADARADVDSIERATFYIQDRTSLPSYASVESDASSIESIATVFPLIFFTVAVLISLTTVTRMVEEDRGLIGVYKALGYGRGRILSKYLIYAFAACLTGGIAGDILGFVALPEIIFTIFRTMYALPEYQLCFNAFTAFWGIALFAIGIVGATFLACRHVLRETPASLMRPKAPRAGKRILLERVTPLWRRMGFLNKVSARNLFRYKKRFLMTVFGIAGCTALMICGLGIRDTVVSFKPRQYGAEGVVRYNLMAVVADADFEAGEKELRATGKVDQLLEARIDTVTAEYGGVKESVQLMVVPDNADLSAYLRTEDGSHASPLVPASAGGADLPLPDDGNGVLITKNAEQVLGFGVGDELSLQDSTLRTGTVKVDGITINYLGNFVFMTEDAYRAAFGEACVPNAFLVNLKGTDAQKIELADKLAAGDTFVSISSSTKIANDFQKNFKIIDVVVYVVTVMAAALAFAVVFTLSNTNISERERELATIKVLGFRKREVHRYINKETVILTLIGILAGCPLGYAITRFLTYVLRTPSLFFDTIVEWPTYVFAGVMSLVFTLLINKMTDRSLDKIDMVGALKSAE